MKKQMIILAVLALVRTAPAVAGEVETMDDFKPGKWVIASEKIVGTIIETNAEQPRATHVEKEMGYTDSSAYITLLPENIFVIQGYEGGDLTGRLTSKTFGTWSREGNFVELVESGTGNTFSAIINGSTLVINSREIEYSPNTHTDVDITLTFTRDEILPAPVQAEASKPGDPQG